MLAVELSPRWQAQQIGSAYVTQCGNEPTAGSGALTLERLQLGKELAPLESVVMMLAPQWAAWQLRWRNTCRDLVHANEFHRVLQGREREGEKEMKRGRGGGLGVCLYCGVKSGRASLVWRFSRCRPCKAL